MIVEEVFNSIHSWYTPVTREHYLSIGVEDLLLDVGEDGVGLAVAVDLDDLNALLLGVEGKDGVDVLVVRLEPFTTT